MRSIFSSDLQSIENALIKLEVETSVPVWYQGGISSNSGSENSSTTRVRTEYKQIGQSVRVSIAPNYKFAIIGYSDSLVSTYLGFWNGVSFAKSATWFTDNIWISSINKTYYLRIVLAKSDDSTLSETDANNNSPLTIFVGADDTLSKAGAPADAAATGIVKERAEASFAIEYSDCNLIADNTDLDDLTTPGNYYCGSAANVSTLSNCPVTSAFRLLVFSSTTGTRVIQFIFTNSVSVATFNRYYDGTNWRDWNRLATTDSVSTLISALEEVSLKVSTYDGQGTLGDQTVNTICRVYQPSQDNVILNPVDAPDGVDLTSYIGWLITSGSSNTDAVQFLLYPHNNVLYHRIRRSRSGQYVWSDWKTLGEHKKPCKVLVIGNSTDQDAIAYVPAVMPQILPDYEFTFGCCYTSSASVQDHVDWYNIVEASLTSPSQMSAADKTNANGFYTNFSYWTPTSSAWSHMWSKTSNAKCLKEILSLQDWDIIIFRGAGAAWRDISRINSEVIKPGRQLLRILQKELTGKPFKFVVNVAAQFADTVNWRGVKSDLPIEVYAARMVRDGLGIDDAIPTGIAINRARKDQVLGALTRTYEVEEQGQTVSVTTRPMCYDTTGHLMAGIPDLISSYVIAMKIAELVGEFGSCYGNTWIPTNENALSIAARGSNDDATVMTHGASRGLNESGNVEIAVDSEGEDNLKKAQDIASWAVCNTAFMEGPISPMVDMPLIVSFVDDDSWTTDLVQKYHDNCVMNGIRGTYAVISKRMEDINPNTNLPYTDKDILLSYEDEGFGMVPHCKEQGSSVYNDWHANASDAIAVNKCRASITECIRKMRNWGFLTTDIWITPYGVHQDWIRSIARSLEFRAMLTYGDGVHNGGDGDDRYWIKRIPLEKNDTINSNRTLAAVKAKLDAAASEGCAWAIVTTHFNEWGDLTWNSATGYDRFNDIVQYAISKGFSPMTIPEAMTYYEEVLYNNGHG